MHRAALLLLLPGCYQRPDVLPDVPDRIPFVETGCAPSREAMVACTLDGDTFDVGRCGQDQGERIRMLGIDAPEIAHEEPAQCWGNFAADQLRAELSGQRVTLSFDVECLDPFGRTLAYVWLDDPSDTAEEPVLVNEWMLSHGYARLFDEDWVAPLRIQALLDDAERDARARGLGLWGVCDDDGG